MGEVSAAEVWEKLRGAVALPVTTYTLPHATLAVLVAEHAAQREVWLVHNDRGVLLGCFASEGSANRYVNGPGRPSLSPSPPVYVTRQEVRP